MSLDLWTTRHAEVSTITLAGSIDAGSAALLEQAVNDVDPAGLRRLVLVLNDVEYLSSAGLRCLAVAHQRLGRPVRIVLEGARQEVADTVRQAGLDRVVTIVDRSTP